MNKRGWDKIYKITNVVGMVDLEFVFSISYHKNKRTSNETGTFKIFKRKAVSQNPQLNCATC